MIGRKNVLKLLVAAVTITITLMDIVMYDSFSVMAKEMFAPSDISDSVFDNSVASTSTESAAQKVQDESFQILPLSAEIKERMMGKSYTKDAKISFDDLRYVQVLYYGFDERTHQGELVVSRLVAREVADIFKELYEARYPIEKMVLIDDYDGDDELSMADNNTSSFCWREISGGGSISQHGLGLAIDLNPLQNPYIKANQDGSLTILPKEGEAYSDRTADVPGLIVKGDVCYQAFISRGWLWGGDFAEIKDYQHFYRPDADKL